jgi:hypothetical protein
MTTQEKIEQAVLDARQFPNPTIEYNFDDYVDALWFEDIPAVQNPKAPKNSAKVIYKLS